VEGRPQVDPRVRLQRPRRVPAVCVQQPRFGNLLYRGEFLIESGAEDRYAGFVFRLRDPRNYYAVRFSASENNVFFARFDDGVRTVLKAFDAQISSKQWHAMRLAATGDTVAIFLDGTSPTSAL
jgi:Thrombospondin C-terminal region